MLREKFAVTRLLNIPPHLNCVTTLPSEIQIFENYYNPYEYTTRKKSKNVSNRTEKVKYKKIKKRTAMGEIKSLRLKN